MTGREEDAVLNGNGIVTGKGHLVIGGDMRPDLLDGVLREPQEVDA